MSNSNLCDAGDLMKSIYLLMYKAEEGVLEIRAKDFHSNYMTAVDILDDDTYLGAEISYNLFTVRKNSDAAADEDRNRLEVLLSHGASLREDACSHYHTYSFYAMTQEGGGRGAGGLYICVAPNGESQTPGHLLKTWGSVPHLPGRDCKLYSL